MKNLTLFSLLFLFVGITLVSCKKDDPTEEASKIEATDFSIALTNNVQNNDVVGTVSATTNRGTLSYSITSQEQAGVIAINATTGQITVVDKLAAYRFRCTPPYPPHFTVTITISNGTITKNITLTVGVSALGCA